MWPRSDGDLCVADKPCVPVRDHGVGKELQVRVIGKRNSLALRRIIGVHRMDLGCRLRGDVRLRARTKGDVQSEPVSLQQAARGGDQEHVGQAWHFVRRNATRAAPCRERDVPGLPGSFVPESVLETETEETRLAPVPLLIRGGSS